LPLVAPGIAGAALLAFSLSFDDFIITNFNSGGRSRSRCTSGPRRPAWRAAAGERHRETSADLLVVGGGFTGLWTALLAKEDDPAGGGAAGGRPRRPAATGRNGGSVAASLTHGFANGLDRFADEMHVLDRLGQENLEQIEATIERYGIDV
jgi:hypothetical protein